MKSIIICGLLLGVLGISCTPPVQEKHSGGQERPLDIESELIQEGYEVFTVIELGKPLADHIYLLAKHGEIQLKIRDTEGFAQIVREISSQEQALELVRMLTSQEVRPFLKDIYYSEIHKKENAEDRWFAIEPEQYEEWKFHEPVVTEEDGVYKIERFVACYPRLLENKEVTQAKLVKIWEWVDSDGKYLAEIQEEIAKGDAIHKILIFTK
jgi:hypothetical protein